MANLKIDHLIAISIVLSTVGIISVIINASLRTLIALGLSLILLIISMKKFLDVYGVIISTTVVMFLFNFFRVPFLFDVNNTLFFNGVFKNPSLGFAEGYMRGLITPKRDHTLKDALKPILESDFTFYMSGSQLVRFFGRIMRLFKNFQSISMSRRVAEIHYDLGNDLYNAMTGKYQQYSCGFWPLGIRTLDDAQRVKLELTLKKLWITNPNMKLLDIGCGFGVLLRMASDLYKTKGVGLTLSKEQLREINLKKDTNNRFLEKDYRDFCNNEAANTFDRIVSVGMFEHVGRRNYSHFFSLCRKVIKQDGVFVLHTVCSNSSNSAGNPFIEKYIFPGGELPSIKEVLEAAEPYFTCINMSNYGKYYANTLNAWNRNSNTFFDTIDIGINRKYNDEHRRMWNFYLTSCEVSFELGRVQLVQFVFIPLGSKENIVPHYDIQDVYDSSKGVFINDK